MIMGERSSLAKNEGSAIVLPAEVADYFVLNELRESAIASVAILISSLK
jgi:hypothetical protein